MNYYLKKFLQTIFVMFLISILSFAIIYLAPGDVSSLYITPDMNEAQRQAIITDLGLDRGFWEQYASWLIKALHGDLGISLANKTDVWVQFSDRLPATILLMGTSIILSVVIAIPLGLISGYKKGTLLDSTVSGLTYVGMALPSFWLGMILVIFFTGKLQVLPSSGMRTPGVNSTIDLVKHMIMPVITLTVANLSTYTRYIRSSVIQQLGEEYVVTAFAKGTSKSKILSRHVLKNSLLPIITLLGMSLPSIVTGSFIIESVFGWPGVGTLAMTAINARDYPIIMAYILISGFLLVLGNFLADVFYAATDPRINIKGR